MKKLYKIYRIVKKAKYRETTLCHLKINNKVKIS